MIKVMKEDKVFSSVEMFLTSVVTDDDVMDFLTDSYGFMKIPTIGNKSSGELIRAFTARTDWEVLKGEYIGAIAEVITEELEETGKSDWKGYTVESVE